MFAIGDKVEVHTKHGVKEGIIANPKGQDWIVWLPSTYWCKQFVVLEQDMKLKQQGST